MTLALAAAILACPSSSSAVSCGDALDPRWKLGWAELARYACFDTSNGPPRASDERRAGLFGYELEDGRVHHPRMHTWRDIPLVLGFTLPAKQMEKGKKVPLEMRLDRGSDYEPLLARGHAKRVDDPARSAWTLHFELEPMQGTTRGWHFPVEGGSFDATVDFDLDRGVVSKLAFELRLERTGRGREGATRIVALQEELRFDRILAAADPKLAVSVDAALERGVAWLWANRDPDGTWGPYDGAGGRHLSGKTALALLAILKGSVDRSDARARAALDWMLAQEQKQVYDVALTMLALEAWYSPSDHKAENGRGDDAPIAKVDDAHRKWMRTSVEWLVAHAHNGWWAYPGGERDMSNTQFAVLGILAASRFGVLVPDELLVEIVERYITNQARRGRQEKLALIDPSEVGKTVPEFVAEARGWTYYVKDERYPYYSTVTAAGVASLTILDALLRGRAKSGYTPMLASAVKDSIRGGWAWLHDAWNVRDDAVGDWSTLWLYTLMRAGVLCDVVVVGKHDWYREGARWLVATQDADGGWRGSRSRVVDTAFAVLFLRRATIRVATGTR